MGYVMFCTKLPTMLYFGLLHCFHKRHNVFKSGRGNKVVCDTGD